MTDAMDRQFVVRDHERELKFEGVLLGHASSERPNKRRWSEVNIYQTDGGTYIVGGIGMSIIKAGERFWDDRSGDWAIATQDEQPRYWAHVSETAEGVVQSLYLLDDDNVRYMTRIAREALTQASKKDDTIRRAFLVERVA